MAEINSGSGSRSEVGEQQSGVLDQEKTRVGSEIIAVLDESENVWKNVSAKQMVLHRLYAEQIVVSDKFTEYNLTWRGRDFSISENINTFHQFTEIDEQVQLLNQFLDEFELKVNRAAQIVKGFIRDMKAHIASLKQSLAVVIGANCVEDLANVTIPNLSWIHAIPDPEIEMLATEWDQVQLDPRITLFLNQLQTLVDGSQDSQEPLINN